MNTKRGLIRLRDWKKSKCSSTPGRTKGTNCIASPLDKYVAKRNRSYKHRDYGNVLKKWDRKRV